MTDEREPLMFVVKAGRVIVLQHTVEALIEHDEGCTIVTGNDTHRIETPFANAAFTIWGLPV